MGFHCYFGQYKSKRNDFYEFPICILGFDQRCLTLSRYCWTSTFAIPTNPHPTPLSKWSVLAQRYIVYYWQCTVKSSEYVLIDWVNEETIASTLHMRTAISPGQDSCFVSFVNERRHGLLFVNI